MLQAQLRTKQCVGPHMSILLEIELYVTHGLEMLVSYHFTLLLKCQLTADHDSSENHMIIYQIQHIYILWYLYLYIANIYMIVSYLLLLCQRTE